MVLDTITARSSSSGITRTPLKRNSRSIQLVTPSPSKRCTLTNTSMCQEPQETMAPKSINGTTQAPGKRNG